MTKIIISLSLLEVLILAWGLKLKGFWLWFLLVLFLVFLLPVPYLGWLLKNGKQPGFWSALFLVRPVFAWHFNWAGFLIFLGPLLVLLRVVAIISGWDKLILGMRFGVLVIASFWGLVSIYGLALNILPAKIETLELELPGLKAKDDGLRLVQLSDLHLAWWNSGRELERIVEQIKALKPDLLVITGDLVDHNPAYVDVLADGLKEVKPRLGRYAIIGNHDIYTGAEEIARRMAERGFKMLWDEVVNLSEKGADLILAGMADSGLSWTRSDPSEKKIPQIINKAPQGLPIILLVHRPSGFEQAKGLPVALVLSGHTHGGQLNLPFGGPGLAHLGGFKRIAGLFQEDGQMLYISRGIGTVGFPFRVNCPPEITFIILRSPELKQR